MCRPLLFVLVVPAFCHFQTLLNRRAFLEPDYLHVARERLEYDFKRLEAGLHRLASRLPADACEQAGGSVPSESSDSTSTATGQGARSTQSAPGAMVGRERRHKPEDVHRHSLPPRPSAMRSAGAAQPKTRSSADGRPRRCSWSAETLAAVGTSSAPSSMGRSARRKMRQLRHDWRAEERARHEFALRRSPYI